MNDLFLFILYILYIHVIHNDINSAALFVSSFRACPGIQ